MKDCQVQFIIGKQVIEITASIDPDKNILQQIAENIKDDDNIKDRLATELGNVLKGKPNKIGTKDFSEGSFVPNYTLSTLKEKVDEKFGTSSEYDIYYTNSISYDNSEYVGKIVKQGKRKIFFISPAHVKRFAEYTRLVDEIKKLPLDNEFLDRIKDIVPTEKTKKGKKKLSGKEVLLDFLENVSEYKKNMKSEQYSEIYQFLESLLLKSTNVNGNSVSDLVYLIDHEGFRRNEDGTKTLKKSSFRQILLDSENVSDEDKAKIQTASLTQQDYKILLHKYYLTEAESHVIYDKYNPDKIIVKPNFKTISEKLSIGFDTILDSEIVGGYKGYNIYKFVQTYEDGEEKEKEQFIAVDGYLTPNTSSRSVFNLREEVEKYIDQVEEKRQIFSYLGYTEERGGKLISRSLINENEFGLQKVKLPIHFNPRDIIRVLSYSRNTPSLQTVGNYTMKTFRELIKERYSSEVAEEIIENLNRPQQAFYFLKYTPNHERYSKNVKVQDAEALDLMNDILDNGELQYYVVVSSQRTQYEEEFIVKRVDDNYAQTKDKKPIPIARAAVDVFFEAIKTAFSNQGMHIEVINDPKSDAKAYLQNGIIYLNKAKATYQDAMHEYTHLFLQMVKLYQPELYDTILNEYEKTINDDIFKYYKELYKDKELSNQDIYEEILADNYSKYLSRYNAAKETISLFNSVNIALEKATGIKSLYWDTSGNDKFKSFMDKFFKFVKESTVDIGITLPISEVNLAAAQEFIQNDVKEVKSKEDTEFLSKICK